MGSLIKNARRKLEADQLSVKSIRWIKSRGKLKLKTKLLCGNRMRIIKRI